MSEEEIIWRPYGPYLQSRVARFMEKHGIATWQELALRSQKDPRWFWPAALGDLGLEWFKPFTELFDDTWGMPWTKWFLGGKLNITHNCLDRHIRDGKGEKTAIFFEGDMGSSRTTTYRELFELVNALARSMRALRIRKGDVIGMCLTISPEAVAVMFAAMKIGAVPMQIAARTPPEEVALLLNRGKAKMLFVNDLYPRGGKWFDLASTRATAQEKVQTLRQIVVVRRLPSFVARPALNLEDFLALGEGRRVKTSVLDAEDKALILFSSGTTGTPKAIVHTHGGALAQIVKEVGYAFDCRESDVFYWFTNIGWMMAPWEIIGSLFFGASVVLYEGTHLHPTPSRVFEIIQRYGVTIFGFTPTALRALAGTLSEPAQDLSTLRILGSTGEPLDSRTWLWYFNTFGGGRCPIMNISGGTEIVGCFLSPHPMMSQKSGTLGSAGLGMDVDVFNDLGESVEVGEGYLVCKSPFPSMTRGFLGEKERYLKTYFSQFPNVWTHGDRAYKDNDGFWYVLGRSDDLIVRGGVKHDPSIIEAALISYPGSPSASWRIEEAAAVGVKDSLLGQRIVAFVVLAEGPEHSRRAKDTTAGAEDLAGFLGDLRAHVGKVYDPMGRPDEIHIVSALPKNAAAKIPRALIRKACEEGYTGGSGTDFDAALREIASSVSRET